MANKKDETLYQGLKALSQSAFPKQCKTCNRIFESEEDFICKSEPIRGSTGLKAALDDDDSMIVELYRNCTCGSTLMDYFTDRRDLSERGMKRRAIFSKVLTKLVERGIPVDTARQELLTVMRGEGSRLMERFGIVFRHK